MNNKHTGLSAVKIAVEMVNEGLIDKETAIKLIPADSISSLLVPVQYQAIYFSPKKDGEKPSDSDLDSVNDNPEVIPGDVVGNIKCAYDINKGI